MLPPLAGGQTHVELLDAAGLPKSWAFVKTGEKARKKSTPRDLTVLEPQTGVVMLFRVMADGKPLEGVRAFEAHATRSIRGISDAQGWMRYVYTTSNPTLNRWHALRLVFDKPGYALTEMPQVFVVHAKGGGAGQGLFAGGLALLD